MNVKFALLSVVPLGVLVVAGYRWQNAQMTALRRELAELRERERVASDERRNSAQSLSYLAQVVGPTNMHKVQAVSKAGTHEQSTAPAVTPKSWDEEYQASLASVEASFAGQAVDAGWGMSARRDLRDRVSAALPASISLQDVECRASSCRAEFVHHGVDDWNAFVRKSLTSSDGRVWDGAYVMMPAETKPDGSVDVIMYLARPGTSLFDSEAP
jgi:hypothetical protein